MATPPPLRLEIRAHPLHTYLLVRDGAQTLLTGWLPPAPAHPPALPRLSEGLALWWNRALHVVLDVADPEAWWSGAPRWDGTGATGDRPRGTHQAIVRFTPPAGDHSRGLPSRPRAGVAVVRGGRASAPPSTP
jgi:hypothetical protein